MNVSTDLSFLTESAHKVAPRLLGCILKRRIHGQVLSVRIVETEAYDQTDAASHSYKGVTPRTKIMFGPAGLLYVYFTYGMHYCCNVVVGEAGEGAAVLIRAVEPIEGEEDMAKRRNGRVGIELTNGPAKMCQALAVDKRLNGHDLQQEPLTLVKSNLASNERIVQTTRIGISQSIEVPWRFYIQDNLFVSKK